MTATDAANAKTKVVTITVNTKQHEWTEKKISFEQVVRARLPRPALRPGGHPRGVQPRPRARPRAASRQGRRR